MHDLSALTATVNSDQELFIETARLSFEEEQKAGRLATDKGFHESMRLALDVLNSDSEYRNEYSQFVDAMSYSDYEENIAFSNAIASYEGLIALFE